MLGREWEGRLDIGRGGLLDPYSARSTLHTTTEQAGEKGRQRGPPPQPGPGQHVAV